jgi:hypothetical protein
VRRAAEGVAAVRVAPPCQKCRIFRRSLDDLLPQALVAQLWGWGLASWELELRW